MGGRFLLLSIIHIHTHPRNVYAGSQHTYMTFSIFMYVLFIAPLFITVEVSQL
jgi:hypothetical protein